MICEVDECYRNRVRGEINWRDEKITVGAITKTWKESMRTIGGILNL